MSISGIICLWSNEYWVSIVCTIISFLLPKIILPMHYLEFGAVGIALGWQT